jgi:hypothetical protein
MGIVLCDCCSFCDEESLLVLNRISLEGENVCISHSNVWCGVRISTHFLCSGVRLVGCRCVQYGPTWLCSLWNFGRIERSARRVSQM